MKRKQSERLFAVLAAAVALLLILSCLLLFSDCGGGDEWISQSGSQNDGDSFISSDDTAAFEGVYAAPQFCDGVYNMLQTVTNTEEYTDGTGQQLYTYVSTTKYNYRLDIDVGEDGITCRYTFVSIYGAFNDNGALSVDLNTTDPEAYDESLAPFYNLLGQSFTVKADSGGRFLSLEGLDEIIAAHPESASLLDQATLETMAGDLFHQLPATFSAGQSWQVNSFGAANSYTVSKLEHGRFGITIAGAQYELPEAVTDANGYTTAYSSYSPITGSLWISQQDRALQELTTRQSSTGTIADGDGYGMYFTITAATSCVITAGEQ